MFWRKAFISNFLVCFVVWNSFAQTTPELPSWEQLVGMDEKQLSAIDIALVNLACANDLPGAENLTLGQDLALLDQWTEQIHQETEKYLPRFRRNPLAYHNSEGYFRMLVLVTVAMQDFGVRYNLALEAPEGVELSDAEFYADSRDIFIHGMTRRGSGTCSSMPVLYVALGRRLGYPLFLARAKGHLYVCWEDLKERLNIEATNQGMNCYPDEYYHTWPKPLSPNDLASGVYLRALSAREELLTFLTLRRFCLLAHNREAEAAKIYEISKQLLPTLK